MFSGLRTNSIFYVLDKNSEPKLQIGQVVSVSNPQPKFPTYQPGQFSPQPMESVVDIRVKLPDGEMEFKQLPSNGQLCLLRSRLCFGSRVRFSTASTIIVPSYLRARPCFPSSILRLQRRRRRSRKSPNSKPRCPVLRVLSPISRACLRRLSNLRHKASFLFET